MTDHDTREKLEADICSKLNDMARYSWRTDGIYRQAIEWLDRQAAITERECSVASWQANYRHMKRRCDELQESLREYELRLGVVEAERNQLRGNLKTEHNNFEQATTARESWKKRYEEAEREVTVLQSKLDRIDETHMELPVDADGVPIRIGDVAFAQDEEPFEVRAFQLDALGWFAIERLGSQWNVNQLHHVTERTVEDVLREFAAKQHGITAEENAELIARYAAELRELMGGDA